MTGPRPVPVALCIKHPAVAEIVSKTLLPEYESKCYLSLPCSSPVRVLRSPAARWSPDTCTYKYVAVQVFHDGDSLRREWPGKLAGLPEEIKPGYDTNSTIPRVVIIGGAIDEDIVKTFRQLSGSDRVLWLQDSKSLPGDVEEVPNLEELGVSSGVRMKKCLVDHGVVFEKGRVVSAGELWLY